ncbi:MAG: universal stress protein [Bacteroidales bacterium]
MKNLLVPVDFRDPSLKAFRVACRFASDQNFSIVLLNVLETPGLLADFFASGDHLVRIADQAKNRMLELASPVKDEYPGLKITTRVEKGKPYQEILEVAEDIRARMIFLGENHQGSGAEQELGTTVYHVTLKSPVPVLTVKGNIEKPGDKIVVPLDLTRSVRRQLFSALVYGLNYGAEIHLVSVVIGGISIKDSRIYQRLKDAKKSLEENGVHCHMKLFERSDTPPYIRVLEYTREIGAGMILVMTHEEGYTYDNYIGAFAHHIINESEVPVMTLTSSASKKNFGITIKGIVDPLGMLFAT